MRRLAINGLTDITLTIAEFKKLNLPVKSVFITENKINGLSFPDFPEAIVIFGLGYGVDVLAGIRCLQNAKLYYWGDLDSHGFTILSRLRAYYPQVNALLMDEQTLDAFQTLWVTEPKISSATLENLTVEEQRLLARLKHQAIRLEQERVGFSAVTNTLKRLNASYSVLD